MDTQPEGRQIPTGQGQRDDPGDQDGRTSVSRQLGQQRAGQEQRVHDHCVDRCRGQQILDGVVLALARADEDVLDVEGERGQRRQALALGEARHDIAIVEVRLRRERDVLAPVAFTTPANLDPVRNRTVSPRATRWAAIGSSGATWPWIGTAAMRWLGMTVLLCGKGPLVRFGTGLVY